MSRFDVNEQLKGMGYGTGLFPNPFDVEYIKDPRNSYASAWDALDKMAYWDAELVALDQIRRLAVMSFESSVEPDSDNPQDKQAQEFIIETIKRLDNWDQLCWRLLDVHAKGLAVALKQFEREGNRIYYKNIIPLPQYWFYFKLGEDGPELWFRSRSWRNNKGGDFAVNADEFAVFAYDATVENPYGRGYIQRCLYPYLQKQILTAYSLQSVQNDIDPLRWAILAGTLSGQKGDVRAILADMKRDTAAVFDEGTQIFVQPPGGVDALRSKLEFRRFLAEEEAKIILGQTLTTDTPTKGGGTFAQAKVHSAQKDELVTAAAKDFERQINHQLIYPLLDMNFFSGRATWKIKYEPATDRDALAARMKNVTDAIPDFEWPKKWTHHELQVPEPTDGEEVYIRGRAPSPFESPPEETPGNIPSGGPGADGVKPPGPKLKKPEVAEE